MSIDSLMSRLNPAICWILRTPIHWPLSSGLMLLTVRGKKTGRSYTIPVGYQFSTPDDRARVYVMVSEARNKQWFRNYFEPARLELNLRGRPRAGTAVVVNAESDEFRERAETTLRRVPWMGRVFHVAFDRQLGLTDVQLNALRHEIAIVQISLDPMKP